MVEREYPMGDGHKERSEDLGQGSPPEELTTAFDIHNAPPQLPLWGIRVVPVDVYPKVSER